MYWHEILYSILNQINVVVLFLIGIPFSIQLIYMLFFWVKKTTFKKSEVKGKACIVIPAHNEEDVIYSTVKNIIDKQNYPKDKIDIYVICHNCTDKTEELALKAGAKIIKYTEPDKNKGTAAWCLNYGFKWLYEHNIECDFFLHVDADNYLNDDFISLMNDAYQSGVEFARPYESAINITQSGYTQACGLYNVFESRYSSRVRERLHLAAHVNGPGAMMSHKMIFNNKGYNCESISDDLEFNLDRMLEGYKGHFVEDAIVYEDLPSTFKDTYARNKRMGCGIIRLIFTKGLKMFLNFFTTLRFSYLEMFLTLFFIIICVLLCTWIPLFYVYDAIYLSLAGTGVIETTLGATYYLDTLFYTLKIAGIAILFLFIFAGTLQATILVLLDYKKMGAKRRRDLIKGIFLYPFYSVVYIMTITLGVFSKPKWKKVARNRSDLK